MALTGSVCMDRYEARLLKRENDGSLAPFPPYSRPTGATFVAESTAGVRPQGYISRVEAASACENAGKRLCTVNEWYHACRGEHDTLYPYGGTYVAGRCNVGKPHLLSILHGKDPMAWKYDAAFNDPELDQRPGFLAETGEYTGCVTSAGIFDLVGNLHEWVSDRVDPSIVEKLPLTAGVRARVPRNYGKGIFMGGFFSTTNQHGDGCNFVTMAHEPGYHDYSTGFRCCKDAPAP
jgi:formylglycine-generating enzyme required for sulfatase activity